MVTNVYYYDVFDSVVYINELFVKEYSKKYIINNYNDASILYVDSLNDNDYIYNLCKLPNLTTLIIIGNINNEFFFEELHNLKNLTHINMTNINFKNCKIYIKGISLCTGLRELLLNTNLKYFPKEFMNMKNLISLYIENVINQNQKIKNIPRQIIKLKNLCCLTMKTNKRYVIRKKKMLIFEFNKHIRIPKKISHLKVINYENEYINNLPNNVKVLELCVVRYPPIINLPICLEKLIIHGYDDNYYYESFLKNLNIKSIHNNIKIPFGCKIVIKDGTL